MFTCLMLYATFLLKKITFEYFYIKIWSSLLLENFLNFVMTHLALRDVSNFLSNENAFLTFSNNIDTSLPLVGMHQLHCGDEPAVSSSPAAVPASAISSNK